MFEDRCKIEAFSFVDPTFIGEEGPFDSQYVYDLIRPFDGEDHKFALVSGDAEHWDRIEFQRDDPYEWGGTYSGAGQQYADATHVKAYPWFGWVEFGSGGLDV